MAKIACWVMCYRSFRSCLILILYSARAFVNPFLLDFEANDIELESLSDGGSRR